MNNEILLSMVILIAVAAAAFLCAWLIGRRLNSVPIWYSLAGILWVVALLSVWFIDTNVPLHLSHYRPGGEFAPTWLASLVWFVRSAAFAATAIAASKHRKASEPSQSRGPLPYKGGAPR